MDHIFTLAGMNRFCRAQSAESARRIFSRSLNADKSEGARPITVSIDQVCRLGHMAPAWLGASGYDDAVKKMPQRFKDDTIGESYMSADIIKDAAADKAVKNAESIIAAYFD